MDDNPLDAFLSSPGMAGDVARDQEANPALPGEMPDQTQQRVISQQGVQQRVQQNMQRMKGRDLAQRNIPAYTDPNTGDVSAVTDQTGAPVTQYDKGSNVGYDGAGRPVQLRQNLQGPPTVEDAFTNTPVTTTDNGDQYQIRKGLGWKYTGQDPATADAALEVEKQKAVTDAATALGRQLTLDERQQHRDTTEYAARQKSLLALAPTLADNTDADPDAAHKLIDDHFDSLYADPAANEKAGWFGNGGYSPQATVIRQQLDAQKAAAHSQLDDLSTLKETIAARGQHIDQQTAIQQNLLTQRANTALQHAADIGAIPPEQAPGSTAGSAATQGADAGSNPAPDTDQPPPAAVASTKQALDDARAGKKDYQFDDTAGVHFTPDKIADGLKQAAADGVVDPKWAEAHQADFQAAQDKYNALQSAAGGAQELKALLHGGGVGAAFWAGSIPGAKAGVWAGALVPGADATGIPEAIGGALGGLATGTIAAFAARKALDKLADYSDTIKSLNASAELHPVLNAAGEMAGMSIGAPKAISNLYQAAKIAGTEAETAAKAAGLGLDAAQSASNIAAVKLVGKMVGAGAIGGAAFEGAVRPVFDMAKNAVADQLGIQHDQFQSPTLQSIATNVALGIVTAGHNIKFKDYTAGYTASILTRAQIRTAAGVGLDEELTPTQMAEAATKLGIDSNAAAKAFAPLSKEEISVFNSIGNKAAAMKASGNFDDATVTSVTARQAVIPKMGSKDGTPIATATIETKPGEPGAAPEQQPRVGAPPPGEKPVSGRDVTGQPPTSAGAEGAPGASESAAEPPATPGAGAPTVDAAAHEAATSPSNELATPTAAQKEAGNYPKGHVSMSGMDISVENPQGSIRTNVTEDDLDKVISGNNPDLAAIAMDAKTHLEDGRAPQFERAIGQLKDEGALPDHKWGVSMKAHYGYIRGTEGNDGDHLDAFIKPGTPLDYKGPVFVVNQQKADGTFDEHKAVIGVSSEKEARDLYSSNYSKVPGIHSVATFKTMDDFKQWAKATRAPKAAAGDAEGAGAVTGGNAAPAPEALAKEHGVTYQGASDRLHAFKDPETGGNFSVKPEELNTKTVGKKLADLRESFKAPQEDPDKIIAEAKQAALVKRSSQAHALHAELTKTAGITSPHINKKQWEEQADELQGNPERYHPVHEVENEKGLKIGDTVRISEGKTFSGSPEKGGVGVITTFDPRDGRPQVSTVGSYGGFIPIERLTKIPLEEAKAYKTPPPPPTAEQISDAHKTAKAALALHADELKALGHPKDFEYAPVPNASGISTDVDSHRITLDKEKFAAAVGKLSKEEAATWIKRAVAHEVIHVGTLKYAEESAANKAKLLALNEDKELMTKAGDAYGKEWAGLSPFAKAAEAARMLVEGPEELTEASYKFLADFLKWLREKLGKLSKDVRDVIQGIEQKMGRFKPEEAATKPPKAVKPPKKAVTEPPKPEQQLSPMEQALKDAAGDLFGAAHPFDDTGHPEPHSKQDATRIRDASSMVSSATGGSQERIAELEAEARSNKDWRKGDGDPKAIERMRDRETLALAELSDIIERNLRAEKSAGVERDPGLLDWIQKVRAENPHNPDRGDYLAAAEPESYDTPLPAEKRRAIQNAILDNLPADATPETFAASLKKLGPKALMFSQPLWFIAKGGGAVGPDRPDWKSIYTPKEETAPNVNPEQGSDALQLANKVAAALERGPVDRHELGKMAKDHPRLSLKEIDEAAEHGVVLRATAIAHRDYARPVGDRFDELLDLYNRQPNLTAKTSTSKIQQAYSTPVPLAFTASRLVYIQHNDTVLEPTAGNGALLIETDPKTVHANEIDPTRAAALKAQGYDVTSDDATRPFQIKEMVDRVLANPPFGVVRNDEGAATMFQLPGGGETREIDHAISLNALQNMKDDGRAVLIIGGTQATNPNERRQHYATGERGEFYKRLYEQYGVIDHFTVNGDLYKKQGAGWPVDVMLIAGRRPSPIQLPNQQPPRILNSWADLKAELTRTDDDRITAGKYDEARDRAELGGSIAGIRAALGSGGGSTVKRPASEPTTEPVAGAGFEQPSVPAGAEPGTGAGGEVEPAAGGPPSGVGDGTVEPGGRGLRGVKQQVAATDEAKPQFHKPYVPVSTGPSFGIETPAGLAEPQRASLEEIQKRVGMPLSKYAAEKMGYGPKEDIGKYFAAEQVDAIASAIYNIENGGALVLGDMAGVGKGRVVAGLIEYAKRHDLTPIFVTKDPNLYSAMLGDFHNINRSVAPLYTNNDLDILHPVSGEEVKTASQKKTLEAITAAGKLPEKHDAVFTSYHQIGKDFDPGQSTADRHNAMKRGDVPLPGVRTKMLNKLVASGKTLILMDESHLAAGDSIQGRRLMRLIGNPNARVYYSSATFAKRPDSMPLYFKTNLRLAAENPEQLQSVFAKGGVVMQQIASRMLAEDGQYIRRERTFDGVPFETRINTETEERDRTLADEYTRGLRTLLDMSNRVKAAVKSMNEIMVRTGKKMEVPTIKMEAADFASHIHNFVSQYLFAIKAESAAQQAIHAIQTGHKTQDGTVKPHKVIVAVMNTMEQPIKRLQESGMTLEYNSLLRSTLDGLRRIKTRGSVAAGTAEYFTIRRDPSPEFEDSSDEQLLAQLVRTIQNPETGESVGVVNEPVAEEIFRRLANEAFLQAEAEIKQLELGGMPLSPIDHIRQRAEAARIKTGEITGRGIGIGADGEVYDRDPKDITKKGQLSTLRTFNNGEMHLMVINASGSTGISAHSDKNFKNHMPRMMVVAQPHLDINEFIQTLGRIFRSGQVELPRYQLLQTALPAEKRPAAILAKKMASLNANTTSNTDSQVSKSGDTADIFNEYGDGVVWKYLADNPRFLRELQYEKIMGKDGNLLPIADLQLMLEEDGKLARNVASYAGIMPVEDQESFWEDVINRYQAQIAYLDQIGENKLKASAADLGAETVSSKEFTPKKGDKSAFQEASHLETVKVTPKTKPLDPAEVLVQADAAKRSRASKVADYKRTADTFIKDYLARKKETTVSDWSKREPIERERLLNQYNEVWAQMNRLGNTVLIHTGNGKKVGAIVGVDIDPETPITPSKVIFTMLNNTLKHTFKIPASQMNDKVVDMDPSGFEVQYNATREDKAHRMIVTGNLIAAAAKLEGRGAVTVYTKSDGGVGTGILLPGDYDPNAVTRRNVKDAEDAMRLLRQGATLTADGDKVTVKLGAADYTISVPASKAAGGKYWQDPALLRTLRGNQFEQRGALMHGNIVDLGALIGRLDKLGATLGYTPAGEQLGAADPDKISVGDRVTVYRKPGTIVSKKGKKLTVSLDEGGVVNASTDNVDPIPKTTPEAAAAAAVAGHRGQPSSAAQNVAASVAAAKKEATTTWQGAVSKAKAVVGGVKDFFTKLKPVDDYWRAKGEWLGTGALDDPNSTGRQKSDYEVRSMERSIDKKFAPNVQEAVTNFVQAGGDRDILRDRATNSRPLFAQGYQDAANLTPEGEELAETARKFYADKAEEAQKAGLLDELLTDYVNQLWDKRNQNSAAATAARNRNVGDAVAASRLNTKFDNAFHRIHESYFEGEKKGLLPYTKRIGKLMADYAQSFNRVMGNRAFIKQLANEIDASDGRPAAAVSGYAKEVGEDPDSALLVNPRGKSDEISDYIRISHPSLTGWKYVHTDEETGKRTFVQGDLLIHPEFADDLRKTLGKSAIGNVPVLKELRNLQYAVKQTLLSLSAFHFVQEGTHAIGHTVNPFKPVALDFKDPKQRELINGGLMIANYEARRDFMEGVAGGGLIDRIPIIGKFNQELNSILFEDYIPRLKMTMALHALERNEARYKDDIAAGKITREQLVWKTAQQANDAFGEQNYRLMGRSQTFQDILRLSLLAPDFLESRFRFAGDATTKFGGEQRRAILILAAAMMVTAKLVEKALTGENKWDPKHIFSVTYKGREYKLRSVPGDMVDFFADTRRFIYGRISPIISRGIIEGLTGRDWRGQKRTFAEQMEDMLKSPIPMAVRGIVDKRNDIGAGEQVAGALGAHIARSSDITDMRIKGRDWQIARGVQNPDESFPPSKYLPLKNALEDGNEAKARQAFSAIATQQGRQQTLQGFKASLLKPFSGKVADEADFIKSLSPSDRAVYTRAVAKQAVMMSMLSRIAATTPAAAAPSKPMPQRHPRHLMFKGF